MFDMYSIPQVVNNVILQGAVNAVIRSAPFWDSINAINTSIGAGASNSLISPGAGNVWTLAHLTVIPAAAITSLQILHNGVVRWDLNLAANEKFFLNFSWPGWFGYPSPAQLNIKNNTAGAVTVNAVVVYTIMAA